MLEDAVLGAEGLTPAELLDELEDGGRVVVFERVTSFLVLTFTRRSRPHLVRRGQGTLERALPDVLWTLALGWWGFPLGPVLAAIALLKDLGGGYDVTRDAVRRLLATLPGGEAPEAAASDAAASLDALIARARARLAGADDEALPDTPETRRALARGLVDSGRLDHARALAAEHERPGPQQDRALLQRLAEGYQEAGRHEQAFELFAVLVRDFPAAAKQGHLAYLIRRTEKALGRPGALVPPPSFLSTPRGFLALVAAAVALALVAQWGANEWIRAHRTLHVVNGTRHEASVVVPLDPPVTLRVPPGSVEAVGVPEGDHVLRVTRRGETVELATHVRTDYLERFGPTVFVANVDGAAPLLWEQAVYSNDDRHPPSAAPSRVLFGEPFVAVPDVGHAFRPFPREVALDRGRSRVETRVDLLPGPPAVAVACFPATWERRRLDFLELRLRLDPDDPDALAAYVELAFAGRHGARCVDFLAGGAARRPLETAWHRAWQRACSRAGREDEARAEYARALAGDAASGALHALAAGLAADAAEEAALLERAAALAPGDPVVLHAQAAADLRRGDPAGAWARLAQVDAGADLALLTLGAEAATLCSRVDLRPVVRALELAGRAHPLDLALHRAHLEALTTGGDAAAAAGAHAELARRVHGLLPAEGAPALLAQAELVRCLVAGDGRGLAGLAERVRDRDLSARAYVAGALLRGDLATAAARVGELPLAERPLTALLVGAGAAAGSDAAQAARWRGEARAAYSALGGARAARAAALLVAGAEPSAAAALSSLTLPRHEVAALALVLAGAEARPAPELLDLAARLSLGRAYPGPFLRSCVAALRRR